MHVLIAGGGGFIGRSLCGELVDRGHIPVVLSRDCARKPSGLPATVKCLSWNGVDAAPLAEYFESFGDEEFGVVNLAGENIGAGRWSPEVRKRILDSRINVTSAIVQGIETASVRPAVLVQGSAVGFYGAQASASGKVLDVEDANGDGYLAHVCAQWEKASEPVDAFGVRRVVVRTGIVLGKGGGVLDKFLGPFRKFVGGPLGSGRQWISWIHMSDMVGALAWLLENDHVFGTHNLTAPKPVIMSDFCRTLGGVLGRPSWLPVPAAALRMLLGEMADETVLASQRAVPFRLTEEGFEFKYTELQPALQDLLGG